MSVQELIDELMKVKDKRKWYKCILMAFMKMLIV